jgi:hypothetical protein
MEITTEDSRRITIALQKEYYVRTDFIGFARPDADRRIPCLATQPELGLLPEQRTGRASGCFGRPAFIGQNLSRMAERHRRQRLRLNGSNAGLVIFLDDTRLRGRSL